MSPIYFFLFAATLSCISGADVLIQSTKSGLVLDGSEKNVIAVKPDGSVSQRWRLQCTLTIGRFVIVNAKNGLALDLQKGCEAGVNMIVYEEHSKPNQQFFVNSDGTLASACGRDIILQIKDGNVQTVTKADAKGLDVFFKLVEVE